MTWDPQLAAQNRAGAAQIHPSDIPTVRASLPPSSPAARQGERSMSSSTSASHSRWPQYGPVEMTRCPDCPRTALLSRRVTMSDKHGNLGREYVKCEGKPELGKELPSCNHFEWLDEYIKRIGKEGASPRVTLPSAVEQSASANVGNGAEVRAAELQELKQIKKQLKKLVDLKKQNNLIAGLFYFCAICLCFVYLLIISR